MLIKFDDAEYAPLIYEGADVLAQSIRTYLSTTGRRPKLANLDHNFMVQGRGGAVTVTVPMHPEEKSITKIFTPDVALEFADLLDEQVAIVRASMARQA